LILPTFISKPTKRVSDPTLSLIVQQTGCS
jgi:hypothetical protein